jgi:diguanylate cyclase (GGDEF)-like protein/PAS domain S-box-containing protein
VEDDQYPTPEILEGILASLLNQHPDAAIAAVNADSRPVPMPASISMAGRPNGPYRHAFALVDPDDRGKVIEAWDRVLAVGASSTPVRLANVTRDAATLCFVDARRAHGVYLRFLALTSGDGTVAAADKVPVLPARSSSIHKNPMSFVTAIDSATTSMLGWPAEEIIGRRSLEFIHPDDHQRAIDNWMDLITGSGSKRYRARHLRKDGSWVWLELTNHNRLDDPTVAAIVTEMVDVSDEMAVQEELRAQHQLLHRLAEALPLGLLQVDISRNVVYTNDRFHQIVGVNRVATLVEQAATVIPDDQKGVSDAFDAVLDLGVDGDIEVRLQPPGGEIRHATMSLRALTSDAGAVTGAIVAVSDVTESSRLRAKLEDRATYDSLTRCYNRETIMSVLEALLAADTEPATQTGLIFVDLDRFKPINDDYGHAAGDELLVVTADRLRNAVRRQDLVGRIGGDEFVVLYPDVGDAVGIAKVAKRIARALNQDVSISGTKVRVQASIGVAWSSPALNDADELVAAADEAMYESKRGGAGEPVLFPFHPEPQRRSRSVSRRTA